MLMVVVLAGCTRPSARVYSKEEVLQNIEWQVVSRRFIKYQKIVCPSCDPKSWKIGIIKSPEVNAMALGNGKFLVTEGFLTNLGEDVQDAIIAHEVAHEVAGHMDTVQGVSMLTSFAFIALGAVVPGAGYLNLLVNPMITRAFSRPQEMQADRIASWLLNELDGNLNSLEAFREYIVDNKSNFKGGGLFSTHPYPDDRINQIDKILSGGLLPEKPKEYSPRDPSYLEDPDIEDMLRG